MRELCLKYGGALKIETEKVKREITEEEDSETVNTGDGAATEKLGQCQENGNRIRIEKPQQSTNNSVKIEKPGHQENEGRVKIEKPHHNENPDNGTKLDGAKSKQEQKTEPLSEMERVVHLVFSLPLPEDFPFDVRGNRFIIQFTLHENYPQQLPDIEVLNTDFPEKIRRYHLS